MLLLLAGLAAGFWSLDDLRGGAPSDRTFLPAMPEARREALLAGWREAVARVRSRQGGACQS